MPQSFQSRCPLLLLRTHLVLGISSIRCVRLGDNTSLPSGITTLGRDPLTVHSEPPSLCFQTSCCNRTSCCTLRALLELKQLSGQLISGVECISMYGMPESRIAWGLPINRLITYPRIIKSATPSVAAFLWNEPCWPQQVMFNFFNHDFDATPTNILYQSL